MTTKEIVGIVSKLAHDEIPIILPERKMEDRWLSADEIAQHLGVGKNTVYRWITDRGMPAHRVGRLWKFQRNEVDAWIRGGHASEDESATQGREHEKDRSLEK